MAFSKLIRRKNCDRKENVSKKWTGEEMQISNHSLLSEDKNDDEIPLLLDEIRQTYDIQLNGELQFNSNAFPRNDDADAAFDEALNNLQNENANSKSCVKCSKHIRVENVETFRKGQHLAMPGRKTILGKFYKHHAIVKEVRRTAGTRVEMELIHFKKEENSIEINKTTETYDLANDEIMVVEYTCPRYTADVIVRRAESMLRENAVDSCFESYNLITQNCEHFATWCVVGQGESFQVSGLTEKIGEGLRSLFGEGSNIAKAILRMLFISSDEIAGALTRAMNLPEIVLVGASAVYLVYCVVMTAVHIKEYKAKNVCWSCLKGQLTDLWVTFGVFGITSAITYIIFHFALPAMAPSVGVPLLIVLVLLSGALQWSVPKLRRALQSPFQVDKIKICKLTELEIGDVVSLRYYGLPHDIIVTEVHEDDSLSSVGRVRGIHYGLPNVFGRKREIIEEYFSVNLEKTIVKRFDCRLLVCNPPDNVVFRARKRLGETKWTPVSNRSDKFCFWAKVKPRPRGNCEKWDSSALEGGTSTQFSSLFIGKSEVHLMEEIQVGDVLQHDDVGILTCLVSLDGGYGRKFEIEQIIYERRHWVVRSKKSIVDLTKDQVYVKKFHPAHCHPMDTRAERAKTYLGKKGVWWTNDGFIEECIKLNP